MTSHHLACDLGAESGRLMLGTLEDGRLSLEELHRFPNTPVSSGSSLHWDIGRLLDELKAGLGKAAARGLPFQSISTDSWGVDYLFVDRAGSWLPPAFHYRDARTARGLASVRARVDAATLFAETGIQFMPLNTIYQLAAESPERLRSAAQLLMIADGFNYFLSGVGVIEESNASTSQLYNPRTRQWSGTLLKALHLPESLFPRIVPSGTRLGPLRPALADPLGLAGLEVIASCSHDTAAAVAGVPADDASQDWAYLSSGTWSLMGVELRAPLINDACRELNFTNEIGHGGSVRLLKNISGLWLVQECRRAWAAAGHDRDYATLTRLAEEASPFVSLVNPADPRFLAPGQMPDRIARFCQNTGQPVPSSPGAFVRCALESLALLYRRSLRELESLTGRVLRRLHVVGGGSQNRLLNEFTANAIQIPVVAGPAEATAAGNVMVQAIALGRVADLAEARRVIARSFELGTVQPRSAEEWAFQAERLEKIIARSK